MEMIVGFSMSKGFINTSSPNSNSSFKGHYRWIRRVSGIFEFRKSEILSLIMQESRGLWTNGDNSWIQHIWKVQKHLSTEFLGCLQRCWVREQYLDDRSSSLCGHFEAHYRCPLMSRHMNRNLSEALYRPLSKYSAGDAPENLRILWLWTWSVPSVP